MYTQASILLKDSLSTGGARDQTTASQQQQWDSLQRVSGKTDQLVSEQCQQN